MVILFLLMVLVVLAIAVHHWGADSADGMNSSEWERRQGWLGFH
jgi:hypothetical protein